MPSHLQAMMEMVASWEVVDWAVRAGAGVGVGVRVEMAVAKVVEETERVAAVGVVWVVRGEGGHSAVAWAEMPYQPAAWRLLRRGAAWTWAWARRERTCHARFSVVSCPCQKHAYLAAYEGAAKKADVPHRLRLLGPTW